jgi:uncharacterized membrane protein
MRMKKIFKVFLGIIAFFFFIAISLLVLSLLLIVGGIGLAVLGGALVVYPALWFNLQKKSEQTSQSFYPMTPAAIRVIGGIFIALSILSYQSEQALFATITEDHSDRAMSPV